MSKPKGRALEEIDKYSWTKGNMPLVYEIARELLKPTKQRIAISLPLTWETLCVIDAIREMIPNLMVVPQSSGENSSLQPGVFMRLTEWGIFHVKTASEENRITILNQQPDIILDCNFVLGETAVRRGLLGVNTVIIEDTKTGENRMKNYDLQNPFIILDNSNLKREFENKEGIGYSVIAALSNIGLYLPKYRIGIIGYGYVGTGIAKYAKALGAKDVIVCEIDPKRREQAAELYSVANKAELLRDVDIVITAIGREDVISKKDIRRLDKKLILANAGGGNEWVREEMFKGTNLERIHQYISQAQIGLCRLQEVCEGNSINLAVGVSMSEFLDITFAHLITIVAQLKEIDLQPGKNKIDMFDSSVLEKKVQTLGWS